MIIEAIITAYVLTGTMANGQKTHEGSVACPRIYNLGQRVEILGKVYTCHDRTSKKYDGRFDIWMPKYEDAIKFGKRKLKVKICQTENTQSTFKCQKQ